METKTITRETDTGIVATRGNREIYLIGSADNQKNWALELFNKHSFDRVFKAAKRAPGALRGQHNMRVIYAADHVA